MDQRSLKIALVGSRGIPARYSGFETFYEQLAVRLAARGHRVSVYNRSHFIKDVRGEHRGVKIVSLPSIPTKHLDTITHTALSTAHALFCGYDIVYYCIVGNAPLVWLPRLAGARTLLNVDGEDWAREKWSGFARRYQRWCERVAVRAAGVVISDARGIERRYRELYKADTIFVPYGANVGRDERRDALDRWGLEPGRYFFYVGRFVPENAIDLMIRAFCRVETDRKLVIVGDAPYTDDYKKSLRELAAGDPRVVFTGYAFGDDYAQLSSHAYVYIQPSGVEGTRPALLDQMGFGNCVVVRNSAVNMEVIGDGGCFFDRERPEESLADALRELDRRPDVVQSYRERVSARIRTYYNWDWVADFYEDLFRRMVARRPLVSYDGFLAGREAAAGSADAAASAEPPARVNVLGVGVHAIDPARAAAEIFRAVDEGRRGYVTCTSVHGVIEAQDDAGLRDIHNRAMLTLPDGVPTVWHGLEQGFFGIERVYGPDLMRNVVRESGDRTHFLYGSTPDVLEKLAARLKELAPGVRIVGAYSPPFRPLSPEEEADLARRVADVRPDLFWVGLSTPKQEKFMAAHLGRLDATVMLGVGAAFDILAGVKRDAPSWMKRAGLQWVFRMLQEPKRLAPRYARIVPRFLWLSFLQLMGFKRYPAPAREKARPV